MYFNNVNKRRRELGFTITHLAHLVKISVPYMDQIENGKCEPSLEVARRISRALNSTLDEIFLTDPLSID